MAFICRLCSKYELTSSGLAIFGEIGIKRSLAYKIKLTVDVVVSQDDPLPKYVCRYCLGKLEETFTFQESCRRAQLQLRDYFLRGSVQLEENDTTPFKSPCDDDLATGISACDTTILSTAAEEETHAPQKCQELGSHVRISALGSMENTSSEQHNRLVPEIAAMSTNVDNHAPIIPFITREDSTSQNILSSDTNVQDSGVLHSSRCNETENGTGVNTSSLEIYIKEEQIDLGCDYYEPEGSSYMNSKDVMGQRQQSVIINALPSSADVHTEPAALETCKAGVSVMTEQDISSSKAQPAKCTRSSQEVIPGKSEEIAESEDDVCVVEIVKANKTSVAQHWERYNSFFRCKKCLKVFLRQGKCENHIRTHLGVKPYQCNICKQRFRKKRLLNEHDFLHSGRKLYHCLFCSRAFRVKKNFQRHSKKHPEPPIASHMCDLCGKIFKSQWNYWQHRVSKHVLINACVVIE